MNTQMYHGTSFTRSIILTGLLLCSGCGAFSDQTLVTDSTVGAVYLQQLSNRGTTAAFSGPLKAFKASHPITLDPDTLAKAFTGLQVGILASDNQSPPRGIKPTSLFSAGEIAFLSPAVSAALKRAQPDQRIKFQVGTTENLTDGTLHVDGSTIHITLTHYHSSAYRRDAQLPILVLSFNPSEAQTQAATPQTWMEIEPDQPRVAIAISALAPLPAPELPSVVSAPAPHSTPSQTMGTDTETMKAVVDKQAQELEALRAELEALKKQIQDHPPASTPNGTPKNTP